MEDNRYTQNILIRHVAGARKQSLQYPTPSQDVFDLSYILYCVVLNKWGEDCGGRELFEWYRNCGDYGPNQKRKKRWLYSRSYLTYVMAA